MTARPSWLGLAQLLALAGIVAALGIKQTAAGNRLGNVTSRGAVERIPVPGHDRYRWRKTA